MKVQTAVALSGLLASAHALDYWFIPPGLTDTFCNGINRPDWDECEDKYVDWFNSREMRIGPDFLEGQVFTGENCQMRWIQCSNSGYEWVQESEAGIFGLLRNACKDLNAGGVQRQGDLCLVVEDAKNPFKPRSDSKKKREADEGAAAADSQMVKTRSHPRDLAPEANLDRRATCSTDDDCLSYTQSAFYANIRGIEQKVCENVLEDGSKCTKSRSVTIEDSYTGEISASFGIKEAIDLGASFSTTHSESITTELSTTLTLDCPGGSGYMVYWPFMEISKGTCTVDAKCTNGQCGVGRLVECGAEKPVDPGQGHLTGEYGSVCI